MALERRRWDQMPVMQGFALKVSFRGGGGLYHRAVAGGPLNDLARFFEI